jgi:hypothetical protein
MSDDQKHEPRRLTGARIARFIVGIIVFGVLMGIRGEFGSIWTRMLVAACAGAVLAVSVVPLWKRGR